MIINISIESNSGELKLISHAVDFYVKHLMQKVMKGGLSDYEVKVYGTQIQAGNTLVKKINKTLYGGN